MILNNFAGKPSVIPTRITDIQDVCTYNIRLGLKDKIGYDLSTEGRKVSISVVRKEKLAVTPRSERKELVLWLERWRCVNQATDFWPVEMNRQRCLADIIPFSASKDSTVTDISATTSTGSNDCLIPSVFTCQWKDCTARWVHCLCEIVPKK